MDLHLISKYSSLIPNVKDLLRFYKHGSRCGITCKYIAKGANIQPYSSYRVESGAPLVVNHAKTHNFFSQDDGIVSLNIYLQRYMLYHEKYIFKTITF
jgi:hypothetical protein